MTPDLVQSPVEGAVRWLLWGLLLLWAGLLIGGLLLGRPDAARRNRLPLPVRMTLSSILLAAALVWWRAGLAGGPLERFGLWIAVGMALDRRFHLVDLQRGSDVDCLLVGGRVGRPVRPVVARILCLSCAKTWPPNSG
ncbi:MAG TPA: hypothetical protein PKM78_13735 [Anaerolineae bacterium]|nr:hypothetical protein [Anaerolineae bacterium]